jgi:hypothetical protein
MRWEFYVLVFLMTLSGNVTNTTFRVLFSEMMPPRNEVRWFGLQYVLSCATVSTPATVPLDAHGWESERNGNFEPNTYML